MTTLPIKAALVALAGFAHEPCTIVTSPTCGEYIKNKAEYIKYDKAARLLWVIDAFGRKKQFSCGNFWIESLTKAKN